MIPAFTGRIIEWDAAKGCGWIESDGQCIFLHRRDFAERRKRPEVGDTIRFTAGHGPTGLLCARGAVHLNDGGRFGFLALLLLAGLLLLPGLAVTTLPIDPRLAAGYVAAVSLLTYGIYASDKARARAKKRRRAEATLHFLEIIGGWPGAFAAQRRLRHKCSKRAYQVAYWTIVFLYQVAAGDVLADGRFSFAVFRWLKSVDVSWLSAVV